MLVIVGFIVVVGSVLGGFVMAGGHIAALIHPSEFVTIGGAALGGLIVGSPKKVQIDLLKGLMSTFKGSPYNRAAYEEAVQVPLRFAPPRPPRRHAGSRAARFEAGREQHLQ